MGSFFSHNFGIRMGPNFWLGRHTPTHFDRWTVRHSSTYIILHVSTDALSSVFNRVSSAADNSYMWNNFDMFQEVV